jgi:hypothetical protein
MLQFALDDSARSAGTVRKSTQRPAKPYHRLTPKVNAQFSARMV